MKLSFFRTYEFEMFFYPKNSHFELKKKQFGNNMVRNRKICAVTPIVAVLIFFPNFSIVNFFSHFVDTVTIRKPDSPAFEWSTFGHNLCPVFEWSGYRMVGTGPICPAFEWLKQA